MSIPIQSMNVPASVARGTTFTVPDGLTVHGSSFQVRGTFSQTLKLQGSMDGAAWITLLDFIGNTIIDITAPFTDVFSGHWPFLSINVTVNVSGLAIVELCLQHKARGAL